MVQSEVLCCLLWLVFVHVNAQIIKGAVYLRNKVLAQRTAKLEDVHFHLEHFLLLICYALLLDHHRYLIEHGVDDPWNFDLVQREQGLRILLEVYGVVRHVEYLNELGQVKSIRELSL